MQRVLLVAMALGIFAASAKSADAIKDVQLGCRSPNFGDPIDNPFVSLVAAFRQNKQAVRLRVTWWDTALSGWDKGTMHYDRKYRILKYYDVGGAGERGEEFYRKSYLFTGVHDELFAALVKKDKSLKREDNVFPFRFINMLPSYHCRKYKLDDFYRDTSAKR